MAGQCGGRPRQQFVPGEPPPKANEHINFALKQNDMATVIFLRPLLLTLVLFATILTGVALFTPSWRGEIGLISTNCSGGGCGPWWDNQPGWYQTVIILVILAFVVELVAVTWAALSWVGFCPTALNFPLGFLCAVAAALLIASITTFAAGNPHEIVGMSSHAHLGYSYWLAVLSAILMVFATFVACGVAGLFSKLAI